MGASEDELSQVCLRDRKSNYKPDPTIYIHIIDNPWLTTKEEILETVYEGWNDRNRYSHFTMYSIEEVSDYDTLQFYETFKNVTRDPCFSFP
jgi:hypothetical protein